MGSGSCRGIPNRFFPRRWRRLTHIPFGGQHKIRGAECNVGSGRRVREENTIYALGFYHPVSGELGEYTMKSARGMHLIS